jgi:hypothetical protein
MQSHLGSYELSNRHIYYEQFIPLCPGVTEPKSCRLFPGSHKLLFTIMSRTALKGTQPPVQWVPQFFAMGYNGWDMKLTTHLHLLIRLKMHGATGPLPTNVHDMVDKYASSEFCSSEL